MTRVRGIDLIWLLSLAALAALVTTESDPSWREWFALLGLGAAQFFESRFNLLSSGRGAAVSVALKLVFCYALVWATGGIESSYYLIFLLPIVSAAARFRLLGTLLATALTSAVYLSFLLFVLRGYYVPPDGARELAVRVLFFFVAAILVNRLSAANRQQTDELARAYRDLSQAQAEVRRSERLAALGQLSAGLAHEMRNPLGVISASAELLAKNVSAENELAREVAGFIRSEVSRTNALVTRFLDFARPSKLHREVQDLNEVVERAVQQIEEAIDRDGSNVEVLARLQPLPPFSFDATLVESVVMNLLLNAKEAMPGGGQVRVETARAGDAATILVADGGEGIPPDKFEDIFNPFYTTKPRGVGLGLAMVSKFVDSHSGHIAIDSQPGRGATFRISLPLDESP